MLPIKLNFWILLKVYLQLVRCHRHYSLKMVMMMALLVKSQSIHEGRCRPEDAPSGSLVAVNFAFARLLVALLEGVSVLSLFNAGDERGV